MEKKTHISLPGNGPLALADRSRIRNLKPISISTVMFEIIVRCSGEVDLRRSCMPICSVRTAFTVPRHAEANFAAGEHICRFRAGGGVECVSSAGDVGIPREVDKWRDFGKVIPWCVAFWVKRGSYIAGTGSC